MESATIDTCASCGKEGDGLKSCGACKLVKYCNRDCQIAHRPMHKKDCKRRAVELFDEELFKEVEPDDCPICRLPFIKGHETESFMSCCGKTICMGCIHAMLESEGGKLEGLCATASEGKDLCAFCRTPYASSDEENIKRTKKLMDKGNGMAFYMLAGYYDQGLNGLAQDIEKANELWLKAGELGCAEAYFNLGDSYNRGNGVEIDVNKKAKHYWELAAMKGDLMARHNLGCLEGSAGNLQRSIKHFMIAAKAGEERSLDSVKAGFMAGFVTENEYADTLRAYHDRHKEMKSDARDKAEQARLLGISQDEMKSDKGDKAAALGMFRN